MHLQIGKVKLLSDNATIQLVLIMIIFGDFHYQNDDAAILLTVLTVGDLHSACSHTIFNGDHGLDYILRIM